MPNPLNIATAAMYIGPGYDESIAINHASNFVIGNEAGSTFLTINGNTGALSSLGAVSINATGSSNTSIGATSNNGIIALGNLASTVNLRGTINLDSSGNANVNIVTGTSSGTLAVGNSLSTATLLGTVNINSSGSGTTNIGGGAGGSGIVNLGNSSGGISVNGPLNMHASIVRNLTNSITASATHTVAGATALTTDVNVVTTGSANDAVKLPTAQAGMEISVINRTGATIDIWPDITSNGINALGANAGYDLTDITEAKCLAVANSGATAWECEKLVR